MNAEHFRNSWSGLWRKRGTHVVGLEPSHILTAVNANELRGYSVLDLECSNIHSSLAFFFFFNDNLIYGMSSLSLTGTFTDDRLCLVYPHQQHRPHHVSIMSHQSVWPVTHVPSRCLKLGGDRIPQLCEKKRKKKKKPRVWFIHTASMEDDMLTWRQHIQHQNAQVSAS